MMNAAMSCASLRLSGKFGIVACGISRNEAIISDVMSGRFAIDAKETMRLVLRVGAPMA